MTHLAWKAALIGRLLANGLPPDYVWRVAREMTDHAEELAQHVATDEDVERRLGSPVDLAQSIVHGYRQQTWLGRHPWVANWLVPLPLAAIVAFVFYIFTIEIIMPNVVWLYGVSEEQFVNGPLEPIKVLIVLAMHLCLQTLPIALSVVAFAWLTRRLGRTWLSQWPAMLLIAFYFSLTLIRLQWPGPGIRGNYEIDMVTFSGFATQPVTQVLQGALALLCCAWVVTRLARYETRWRASVDIIPTSR